MTELNMVEYANQIFMGEYKREKTDTEKYRKAIDTLLWELIDMERDIFGYDSEHMQTFLQYLTYHDDSWNEMIDTIKDLSILTAHGLKDGCKYQDVYDSFSYGDDIELIGNMDYIIELALDKLKELCIEPYNIELEDTSIDCHESNCISCSINRNYYGDKEDMQDFVNDIFNGKFARD